jgi:hypothetical protein
MILWHLGTCLPQDILGPGGLLPARQRSIEDLFLNTGDPCIVPKNEREYQISLTEFKLLRKFSWTGGLSKEYFNALRDMLKIQAKNLEVLHIDLIDWWDAQRNWCADDYDLQTWTRDNNFFGEGVLDLALSSKGVLFSSLESLSLRCVQFQGSSLSMAHAFHINNLHSLISRDCGQTGSLLRKVVNSGEPINLRSLELIIHHNSDAHQKKEYEEYIAHFLESFEGLDSLRILVSNHGGVLPRDRYWPSILHHKKTLRRLVYHERRRDVWWAECNPHIETPKILDVFIQVNIKCLGLCLSGKIPPLRSPILI